MEKQIKRWPADAFDALSFMAVNGQFDIEGSSSDQVELEGEFDPDEVDKISTQIVGRWLQFNRWVRDDKFILRLPASKPWSINLTASRGDLKISGVTTRLQVMQGRGNIEIESCRGKISLLSSHSNIKINHFIEEDVPLVPPAPLSSLDDGDPSFKNTFPFGAPVADFPFWDDQEWRDWGGGLADKAVAWAGHFSHHFINYGLDNKPVALNIRLHKGDIHISDLIASSFSARANNGDIKMENGQVAALDIKTHHGRLEILSVLPTADWNVSVSNGDIKLDLPAATQARLDLASRDGDIKSDLPLVRVAHPGPEARRGGRMVGAIGSQSSEKLPQLCLTVIKGEIEIRLQGPHASPAVRYDSSFVQEPQPSNAPTASGTVPQEKIIFVPPVPADSAAPVSSNREARLQILQALSEGKISVEEAEQLLKSF